MSTSSSTTNDAATATPNPADYPGWTIEWREEKKQRFYRARLPDATFINVWEKDRPQGDEIANPALVKQRLDAKLAARQRGAAVNASASGAVVNSSGSSFAYHTVSNGSAASTPIAQPPHFAHLLPPPTAASRPQVLSAHLQAPASSTPTRRVTAPPSAPPHPASSTPPTAERAQLSPPASFLSPHSTASALPFVNSRATATVHADYLQTLAQSHSDYLMGAFAELIHNAVDSGAGTVDISCIAQGRSTTPWPSHTVLIADDGCGMSKRKLEEMMRFGKETQGSRSASSRLAQTTDTEGRPRLVINHD